MSQSEKERPDLNLRVRQWRKVPAGKLKQHPGNWRQHPDRQREAFRAVMERAGFVGGLLAFQDTDGQWTLLDGHLRQEELDPNQPVWVGFTDLSRAEADFVLTTFDSLTGMAEVDPEALEPLIQNIAGEDAAIDSLLSELANEANIDFSNIGEPEIPEETNNYAQARFEEAEMLLKKWKCKPGQIYEIKGGNNQCHRLLCGDATSDQDVRDLLDNEEPALMITDPPYGVSYDPQWRDEFRRAGTSIGKVENDGSGNWESAYNLFPVSIVYIWHPNVHADVFFHSIKCCGFQIRSVIIWAKQHFAISRGAYHFQHEPCLYAVRKGHKSCWKGGRKQTTLWNICTVGGFGGTGKSQKTVHSTEKPIECMARPMRNHDVNIVYDPFLGSGTSIMAAEQEGRKCLALEVYPLYVAVALQRFSDSGFEIQRIR